MSDSFHQKYLNSSLEQTLLETSEEVFLVVDNNGIVIKFNQNAVELIAKHSGLTLRKNASVYEIVKVFDFQIPQKVIEEFLNDKKRTRFTHRLNDRFYLDVDSSTLEVGEAFYNLIKLKELGIPNREALDYQRLKYELEHTTRELNQAQEMLKVGSWRFSLKDGVLTWSDMTRKIHGVSKTYTPEVESAIDFYYKADRSIIRDAVDKLINKQEPYDLELRIKKVAGEIIWVRTIGDCIAENGEVTEIYGTFQDINKQRLIRNENLRLDIIIKNTTNEIFIYDEKTLKLTYINKSGRRNTGYSKSEVPTLEVQDLIYGFDNLRFKDEVLGPLLKGQRKGKSLQFRHARKDGSVYDVESTVQSMDLDDQRVVVIIANDVTVKRRDKVRRNLINIVNEVIASSKNCHESIQEILAVVSDQLHFDGGEFWELMPNGAFTQAVSWDNDPRINKFIASGTEYDPVPTDGIFNEILTGSGVSYFEKLYKRHFPRTLRMNFSLPKIIVGFRLERGKELLGIIILYGLHANEEAKEFRSTLSIISGQVSQFVLRNKIEHALLKSAEEKEVLLREIHHRVKNNLQTVSSLLYFKSHEIEDAQLSTFFKDTQNRIAAISYIHEKLLKANEFRVLDIRSYLVDLIENINHTYHNPQKDIDLKADIMQAELPTDLVMNCGLIVNELLSNALQHAFTDREKGIVKVAFEHHQNRYQLIVEDNGVGLMKKRRVKNSIGLQLVEVFVSQIEGKLAVKENDGVKYLIKFKHGL